MPNTIEFLPTNGQILHLQCTRVNFCMDLQILPIIGTNWTIRTYWREICLPNTIEFLPTNGQILHLQVDYLSLQGTRVNFCMDLQILPIIGTNWTIRT